MIKMFTAFILTLSTFGLTNGAMANGLYPVNIPSEISDAIKTNTHIGRDLFDIGSVHYLSAYKFNSEVNFRDFDELSAVIENALRAEAELSEFPGSWLGQVCKLNHENYNTCAKRIAYGISKKKFVDLFGLMTEWTKPLDENDDHEVQFALSTTSVIEWVNDFLSVNSLDHIVANSYMIANHSIDDVLNIIVTPKGLVFFYYNVGS